MELEWFEEREFKKFRERRFKNAGDETVYGVAAEERNVYRLSEVETILKHAQSPYQEFFTLQYLHCRRPGEVLRLDASDVRLADDLVWYPILKQQRGEDNREFVKLRHNGEREILSQLADETEGAIFETTLNKVREELRRVQQEHDIPQLKLKDFRHTRVSHLKAAGWEDLRIRDKYTKHKHLSTLRDKYMSYVSEEISEQDLWRVILIETDRIVDKSDSDDGVAAVVEKYGL
jgi:integrase